jgi:hypothetical protein
MPSGSLAAAYGNATGGGASPPRTPTTPTTGGSGSLARIVASGNYGQANKGLFSGPAKKPSGGGGGGVLGVLGQTGRFFAHDLPLGLAGTAKGLAELAVAPARLTAEAAGSAASALNLPHAGIELPKGPGGLWHNYAERYAGLPTAMATQEIKALPRVGQALAFGATGGRYGTVDPYIQAYEEGHVPGMVLGDIGAAAVVAAPALGRALGSTGLAAEEAGAAGATEGAAAATPGTGLAGLAQRAGYPNLASGLETAGQVVRSSAPENIKRLTDYTAGRLGVRTPGQFLSESIMGTAENPTPFAESKVGQYFTPQRKTLRELRDEAQLVATQGAREAVQPAIVAERLKLAPDEEAAAIMSVEGANKPLETAYDSGDTELFNRSVENAYGHLPLDQRRTPEQVALEIRYRRGELPTEQAARMDEFVQSVRAVQGPRTERATQGIGQRALPAEQLGSAPLESTITAERQRLEELRAAPTKKLGKLEKKLSRYMEQENLPAGASTRMAMPELRVAEAAAQGAAEGRPVIDTGRMTEPLTGVEPAPPKISVAERVGDIHTAAQEHGAAEAQLHLNEMERVIGGERPAWPSQSKGASLQGERDWITTEGVTPAERARLLREGWFKGAKSGANTVDAFASTVENGLGRGPVSTDEAMSWYLDNIRRIWAARGGSSPGVLQNVADQFSMHPQDVTDILSPAHRGGGVQALRAIEQQLATELPPLRAEYRRLPAEEQAVFEQVLHAYDGFGATDADYLQLVTDFFPHLADPSGLLARLTGRVDMRSLAEYLSTGEMPAFPPQPILRPATGREIQRMGENIGRLRERTSRYVTQARTLRQRISGYDEAIANLPDTVQRTFQDRLAAASDPFVKRAKTIARQAGEKDVATAIDRIVEDLTGAKQRFQIPQRVYEAFDAIKDQLPQESINALDEAFKRNNTRLTKLRSELSDLQLDAMPAPWRPVGVVARRQVDQFLKEAETAFAAGDHDLGAKYVTMAEEIPTSLEQLVATGINPTHLIGGEPGRVRAVVSGGALGTAPARIRSTQQRFEGFSPTTARGLAQSEAADATAALVNPIYDKILPLFGRPARERLTDLGDLSQYNPSDLYELAQSRGYVPLRGKEVTAETPLIPTEIRRELTSWENTKPNGAMQVFDALQGKWKTNVTALSPKWAVGNVLGNLMMAMVHAGTNPLEVLRQINRMREESGGWKELWRNEGLGKGVPARIGQHGLTVGERNILYRIRRDESGKIIVDKAPRTIIGKAAAGNWRLNEFVDNLTRSAVYNSKMRRGATSEVAMKSALRALGDYTKMTPFERTWARRVFPFYAWMRHSNLAMARLPFEHPLRAAWYASLADVFSDPSLSDDERDALIGRAPFLGGSSTLAFANPFPAPSQLPTSGKGIANTLGYSLSPIAKLGSAALFGQEIGRGDITQPAGKTGSLLANPAGLAYYGLGQLPVGRAAQAAIWDPAVYRYQTGEPRPNQRDTGRTRISSILQSLGFPAPDRSTELFLQRQQGG